jgi:hypothetical protein
MKGTSLLRLPALALYSLESQRPPVHKIREILGIQGPHDIPLQAWDPVGSRFVVYYEERNSSCNRNRFENYFRLVEVRRMNSEFVLAEGAAGGITTDTSRREWAHEYFQADILGLGRCMLCVPLRNIDWKDWPENPQ